MKVLVMIALVVLLVLASILIYAVSETMGRYQSLPEVEFTNEHRRELDYIAAWYEHCDDYYAHAVCAIWAYNKAKEN